MAGAAPTEDDILQVCAITEVDENSARILLRGHNNDVNAAVNAFFEDPLGSVKEQPPADEWQYQDNIPFADDSSVGAMPAMSRPPSRVDNAGTFVDLTAEYATASATAGKTLKEQEEAHDPHIQQAMAESLRQNLPGQENGVTGTGTSTSAGAHPHFGPASRDYYDPSRWAMTTFSTSREIVDHPPPSKRRRLRGAPVFLRGSTPTDYLGSLLTIYHNIPLARDALLMPSLKVHAYGHDGNWWSGTTDENTKSLSVGTTTGIDGAECQLLAEVQCLMAFLDRTDRAYGSVDALADLQAVRRTGERDAFLRFMEAWNAGALRQAPAEPTTQTFSSVAVRQRGEGGESVESRSLRCVDASVTRAPGETLLDLLDNTVWNDDTGNVDDVWISQAADVFTIRVHDPNGRTVGLHLDLPPVWYADRYMVECKEAMNAVRKQRQMIRREIEQCTHIQRRCELLKLPDNRVLKIRDLLDAATQAVSAAVDDQAGFDGACGDDAPFPASAVGRSDMDGIGSELQAVIHRIEQKLHRLDLRKEELRQRSRQVIDQFTQPTADQPHQLHRKYMLQGVCTRPEVAYLRRKCDDPPLLEDDGHATDGPTHQWWKCDWSRADRHDQRSGPPLVGPVTLAQAEAARDPGAPAGALDVGDVGRAQPYFIGTVSEAEVLAAAKEEPGQVFLVYATDHAMTAVPTELSLPLRHFVDRDNQAFADELRQEDQSLLEPSDEDLDGAADADGDADAEAEVEFENVPLIDQTGSGSSARAFTPMSTSSPSRDEDGQPSPKRAREDFSPMRNDAPPSYEDSVGRPEMQEKKGNKIGLYAEQMLQKYSADAHPPTATPADGSSVAHVEHSA